MSYRNKLVEGNRIAKYENVNRWLSVGSMLADDIEIRNWVIHGVSEVPSQAIIPIPISMADSSILKVGV